MDALLVLGAHLDDSCLSVGQLIAGRIETHVVTIFAGTPPRSRRLTTYDRDSGFANATQALAKRKAEDRAAMHLLGATPHHLDHLDNQYGVEPDEAKILADLVALVNDLRPVQIMGPLGLAHPDHHTARRVLHALARATPEAECWAYEDLPSRVLWPEMVPDALAWWEGMGWTATLDFAGTGDLNLKADALECYASQLPLIEQTAGSLHACLVPERTYRLT